MKQALTALVAGTLFGAGLAWSGMAQPRKVIAFLDFTGQWDPTLLFVMLGAVTVHAVAYRLIRRRAAPLFAEEFALPTRQRVDLKLVAGAALFGVGWALAGYCPGPAIVGLGAARTGALVFALGFVLGAGLVVGVERWNASGRDPVLPDPERQV